MKKKINEKKDDFIYLSALIDLIDGSLNKKPKVKNYNQLKSMQPKLKSMLKNNGDTKIPMSGLKNVLNISEQQTISGGKGDHLKLRELIQKIIREEIEK